MLNYSNTDYTLKNGILKAGLNACILQVIQNAKNDNLGDNENTTYYLKQLKLKVEPTRLDQFVKQRFDNNYQVVYKDVGNSNTIIQVQINPVKVQQLQSERDTQRNIWLYQSMLLLVLVGFGIYGVYYSIDNIYKLNKRQNNFLLSVTHEFKTPIAAIRLMLQTAKNPRVSEEKKAELVDKSIENTYRLEDLAENMLTATQIDNKNYQLSISPFSYSDMVKSIVNNQKIKGDIDAQIEGDIDVVGDEFILRMAINNLVENAFKYSENKPISIKLGVKKNQAILSVKDQGIGISKDDEKNIFKKFYRVQDEETRDTKGTGLGLFIVKRAADRHRGSIQVKANKSKGSTFILTIPLRQL